MFYQSVLKESIHSLSYPCEYVSIVRFSLEILFVHKFLWYHGYLYHDIFFPVHHVVQVKIFHIHGHISLFDVLDGAVNMEFHGGQV